MKASRMILAALLICGLGAVASADVLILKDGQAISGKFQGGDPGGITFLVDGQYRRYALTDIHSITILPLSESSRSSTAESAPSTRTSSSTSSQAPSYSTGRSTETSGAPPAPYPPTYSSSSGGTWSTRTATTTSTAPSLGVTLPAGTVFTVRMIDSVDSSVNEVGETFRASLDEPIVVDGRTVVPRGADVTTKLVSVQEAGRISGRSELALILYDVTINGRKYEITTEEVSQQGSSRGTQSAQRIGAMTAIGAIIGAVAGGGGGAARGAAAGAGAATAVQVLTHGENVQIPAESRLEFTLSNPLTL
jgi:hypothetical protein